LPSPVFASFRYVTRSKSFSAMVRIDLYAQRVLAELAHSLGQSVAVQPLAKRTGRVEAIAPWTGGTQAVSWRFVVTLRAGRRLSSVVQRRCSEESTMKWSALAMVFPIAASIVALPKKALQQLPIIHGGCLGQCTKSVR
jgi:hypothetical protein